MTSLEGKVAVVTDFAMEEGRGRTPDMPELAGMMSADDVAEAVLGRVPAMTETSWG